MNDRINLLKRLYDENQLILVCRKSDYDNNNIGDGYYLVLKDEWEKEEESLDIFHLYLTKISDNEIQILTTANGTFIANQALPYKRKNEYMEL